MESIYSPLFIFPIYPSSYSVKGTLCVLAVSWLIYRMYSLLIWAFSVSLYWPTLPHVLLLPRVLFCFSLSPYFHFGFCLLSSILSTWTAFALTIVRPPFSPPSLLLKPHLLLKACELWVFPLLFLLLYSSILSFIGIEVCFLDFTDFKTYHAVTIHEGSPESI